MPSLEENRTKWAEHPWEREGHEWSPGGTAAGGEMFWWRGLLPRLHRHLPAGRVLEIGPGFGRWTSHLAEYADAMLLVDLTERCIEHCRRRFADRSNIQCFQNDGVSLDMIEDRSVDFVFSFDSLVHAEAAVIREYLHQLARKLKPGGTGFIHHSNLAALATDDGKVPSWIAEKNWRAESMSAQLFREYCRQAGLICTTQEVINWIGRRRNDQHQIYGLGIAMTDAVSMFRLPVDTLTHHAATGDPTLVYVNPLFVHEWRQITVLVELYGRRVPRQGDHFSGGEQAFSAKVRALSQRLKTFLSAAHRRVTATREHAETLFRDRFYANQVRRREPILNSLLQHRCPDCRSALDSGDCCRRCHAQFFYPRPR